MEYFCFFDSFPRGGGGGGFAEDVIADLNVQLT